MGAMIAIKSNGKNKTAKRVFFRKKNSTPPDTVFSQLYAIEQQ